MNVRINDERDYRKYLDEYFPDASERDKEITVKSFRILERNDPDWAKKLEREINAT